MGHIHFYCSCLYDWGLDYGFYITEASSFYRIFDICCIEFDSCLVLILFFFPWPPNYIPFFISLFLICFFYYIKNPLNVWLFHLASVFLNIAFQLHTMSVTLIIGFVLALIVLGKLPRYWHCFYRCVFNLY